MLKASQIALVALGAALLASCGSGGVLGRERPDEFAVQRQAPLVIPPDFALTPPEPGIRSAVGDPGTFTVDKGTTTRTIIAAPEGDGQDARAVIPG